MSLAGSSMLTGLSEFIGDSFSSTTTGAGSTTTLVDTGLRKYGGDDVLRGWYLRITHTGHTAIWEVRRITSFSSATGTCTVAPAFTATTGSGKTYELHRYDPTKKFTALDEARVRAYPDLSEVIFDDTITGDGRTSAFTIPTSMREGPFFVMEEQPVSVFEQSNFLSDPNGDSVANFAASSVTASLKTFDVSDPLVPKYGDTDCTQLVVAASTAGTYSQVVASMTNGVTAATAAGRRMTFGAWLYSRLASKVRVQIIDDEDTDSSAYHQGLGWELLTVSKNIVGNNTTLLTARFDIASTADSFTGYWNRGWFYYGEADRITNLYHSTKQKVVHRDDTTKRFYLDFTPHRGHQIRTVGRDTLSALGTTAATQVTNTMEVDEQSAQLLYAIAAQILFEREGLQSTDPDTQNRIGTVLGRRAEYRSKFPTQIPTGTRLRGMWA